MTDLVHRLLIDVETLVERLWNGGDALRGAWQLLTKRDGMFRSSFGLWLDYLPTDFPPSQHDGLRSKHWLRDNARKFTMVGHARGTGLIR